MTFVIRDHAPCPRSDWDRLRHTTSRSNCTVGAGARNREQEELRKNWKKAANCLALL